jgi:hypothetical protein
LQKHLLFNLKVLKGKQQDMLAQGITSLEHPNVESIFLIVPINNSFKRHRGMLETNAPKNNHLKEKAIKYIHI